MIQKYILFILSVFISVISVAQNSTCSNAEPFCSNTGVNFQNTSGFINAENGPDYGCLGAQPNPAWFFIKIGQTGDLNLNIEQNSLEDFTGTGLDVDYICYGPFTETKFQLGVCNKLTSSNIVDCSFLPDFIENLNIQGAISGQYYVLLVTNFSNLPGFIRMEQTNLDNLNSGATDCSILELALGPNQNLCDGDTVILDATPTTGTAISYTWFLDSGSGYNPILLEVNPTLEVSTSGIYKVEITDIDGNIVVDEIDIVFFEQPIASTPPTITLCDDDNNGTMPFNLTSQDGNINNVGGMSITYHLSQGDADNNVSPLTSPFESGNNTIYARIENMSNTICYDTTSFDIEVYNSAFPLDPTSLDILRICDNNTIGTDTDVHILFDLTQKGTEILNGQSEVDFTITYFTDLDYSNQITTPTNFQNTTMSQTIYVRVTNNLENSCFTDTFFKIEVLELPTVISPVSLKQCDNDTDAFSPFNLTEVNAKITTETDVTFTYFNSFLGADINDINDEILNPTTYINQTQTSETVWARVENTNGCHRVSEINLTVSTTGIPTTFTQRKFFKCDDYIDTINNETDGVTMFDFSSVTVDVLAELNASGQQPIITYYRNEDDAFTETNSIPDPSNYRNIGYPNSQIIYIRIDSGLDNDCLGIWPRISLLVEKIPIANPVTINRQCDDDFDGMFLFDTSTIESTVVGGQTGMIVSYFDQNGGLLPSPLPNPFDTTSQTITIRVTDSNSVDPDGSCFAETTLEFIVDTKPVANTVPIQIECDDDLDGFFSFNTSAIHETVLNGQTGMIVTYFDQMGNPLSSPLSDPFLTNSQTISISVENELNSTCIASTTLDFVVNPKPEFELDETAIYCLNLDPITVETYNPQGIYTYQWTNENNDVISSSFDAVISSAGNYTVIATSVEGCESFPRSIVIETSVIASFTIDDITVVDDSENNSITITTTNLGIGEYEFALQKMGEFISSYQDEPYFEQLAPGIYTVFIRDKNNCGIAQIDVSVIGFPKFFTPNNDGYNDTWVVLGVNENFYASSNIYIFDRFGKLITQINPKGEGWNGLFNGEHLPATDYWFSVELIDNNGNIRIRKGHFSLIRR